MNNNQQEADRWFSQAQHDLRASQVNRREGFPEIACFLAQQAAEKALKGYLHARGERAIVGHAAHLLMRQCTQYEPAFGALADACAGLDQYYIPTRYPNGLPGGIPHEVYTDAQARHAADLAGRVLELVDKCLYRGS